MLRAVLPTAVVLSLLQPSAKASTVVWDGALDTEAAPLHTELRWKALDAGPEGAEYRIEVLDADKRLLSIYYPGFTRRSEEAGQPLVKHANMSWITSGLLPGKAYHLALTRIQEIPGGVVRTACEDTLSFRTAAAIPAAPPTLHGPLDGSSGTDRDPLFAWSRWKAADSFLVEVDTAPHFASPLRAQRFVPNVYAFRKESTDTASTKVADAWWWPHRKFHWRVQAITPDGVTPWSPTQTFTTGRLPLIAPQHQPFPLSPAYGIETPGTEVTLTWSLRFPWRYYVDGYMLRVYAGTDFHLDSLVKDTTFTLQGLQSGVTYTWSLRSADSTEENRFGSAQGVFRTAPAAAGVRLGAGRSEGVGAGGAAAKVEAILAGIPDWTGASLHDMSGRLVREVRRGVPESMALVGPGDLVLRVRTPAGSLVFRLPGI